MPIMKRRSIRNSNHKAPMSTSLDSEGSWSVLEDKGDFSSPSEDNGKGKATPSSPDPSISDKGRNSLPPRTGYDADKLLDLCDTIRAGLHEGRPEPRWEEAMGFLAAVMRDEANGSRAIEFETIRNTHLDKLISDIMDPRFRHPRVPIRFSKDVQLAERLERKWIERFRGPYFNIEQNRYDDLPKTGRLKDVVLNLDSQNPEERWQAKDGETVSEMEGNLEIEPGQWWLNLACAHRDGIVGSARERPTRGKYGVAALPLLTGEEYIDENDGYIRYARQGRITDIHVSLVSQPGATFRILRGYRLQSPFAPKAGIRYDGLYKVHRYSQWYKGDKDIHHMKLTLERVGEQRPIEDILHIPRPSEMDDWELYQKHEGEAIRQTKGYNAFIS
ncbi:hypothetical protein KAF25_007305 [Fusarium avenaceum]|uniref:YDG domain-containing protein n=1 Tax=Fusarium avenaceum TaxID=40199 RepID=A0A9P7H5K3_9HYPO|nr:hypothetical protein KAF25_007305 [Fusarium avenaceum]